jgi:hypothetical protein
MSEPRKFETVSGGSNGQRWEPQMKEKNFMKMGTDNIKEGYLLSSKELPGKEANKPFIIFSIQTINADGKFGPVVEVAGDAVLTEKFSKLSFGAYIRVEYKGRLHKKEIKNMPGYTPDVAFTQTNSYHNWEVGVDPNAIPYAEEAKKQGAPSVAVQQTPAPVKAGDSVDSANEDIFS